MTTKNVPLEPSGGEVYQRLAQIAVYGDVWFDISRETFEATKENGITRILYTSQRVVDDLQALVSKWEAKAGEIGNYTQERTAASP